MLINPFHRDVNERYPDETTIPTGMTHFTGQSTETILSDSPIVNIVKILRQDVVGKYQYSVMNQFQVGVGLNANQISGGDYGAQLGAYRNLAGTQRTLSYGLRAQITGLPVSTFVPSGRFYFLQLSEHEMAFGAPNSPDDTMAYMLSFGEDYAIAAVNAGKGFSITAQELLNTEGGMHIPYLPPGPQSLNYRDTFQGNDWYGNSAPWSNSAPAIGSSTLNSQVYAYGTSLVIIAYGVQANSTITFSYAHHTEYTPVTGCAGVVDLQVAPCSNVVREGISQFSQNTVKLIRGDVQPSTMNNLLKGGSNSLLNRVNTLTDRAGSVISLVKSASPVVQTFLKSFGFM